VLVWVGSTAKEGTATVAATTLELLAGLDELRCNAGEDALGAASVIVEDFLGVAIAGSRTDAGAIIHQYASEFGRAGRCNIAGRIDTFDAPTAALVTGTSGYSIGLTDTHARSITHPGPSIVPTALAIAQQVGATGHDMLLAVILGCEAVVRIGSVVNPSHRARGYHPTATCNVFGAAIAAGTLLGLDRMQLANALGIAGSMSGGLYEFRHEGSMLMAFHGGWPAHNGIVAAYLAQAGFTGPTTVLEGAEGFFRAFADEHDSELLNIDAKHPGVLEIGLRPYNACRYGHAGIDALRVIAAQHGPVAADEVDRMTIATHRTAVVQETEPTSVVGARLSTKFAVAYALVHGPKIDEVDADDLVDPAVQALIARTDVIEDCDLTAMFPDRWACRVRLDLRDGRSLESQVDVPKGEPSNPMTAEDISAKFHHLADPILGREHTNVLESRFAALPEAPEVFSLAHALGGAHDTAHIG